MNEESAGSNTPCPVKTSDDNADQAEDYQRFCYNGRTGKQTSDEPEGEKAVIETLIGCKLFHDLGVFDSHLESVESERLRPKKHLKREKIEMDHSN